MNAYAQSLVALSIIRTVLSAQSKALNNLLSSILSQVKYVAGYSNKPVQSLIFNRHFGKAASPLSRYRYITLRKFASFSSFVRCITYCIVSLAAQNVCIEVEIYLNAIICHSFVTLRHYLQKQCLGVGYFAPLQLGQLY